MVCKFSTHMSVQFTNQLPQHKADGWHGLSAPLQLTFQEHKRCEEDRAHQCCGDQNLFRNSRKLSHSALL